ncbi:MAG: type IV pili methyl-accepting chemotaxis transducer N-terminal domain-containing protein [Burkholderiaceae bacterium]|nr:type IV pili methyl-accepting chemotaxis transducer N-terminal domain-containing protein [Burkholderiaceae bacterium]
MAVLGFSMLLLALVSIALTFWVTWELQGGAAAVNEAGRMRMQAYRLALDAQRGAASDLARHVERFDESLAVLGEGDPSRPLFVPWNDATRERFADVQAQWRSLRSDWLSRPDLVRLSQVDEFVESTDDFVASIESQLSRWTAILYSYQFAMMALAIGGAVALLYTGYIYVVDPVARLRRALARVEQGEFDARVDVVSRDEFGELGEGFNRMAGNLQQLYAGLEDKVREKTATLETKSRRLAALYDASAFIGGVDTLDDLARGFVRKAREAARADAAVIRWSDQANQRYLLLAADGLPDAIVQAEQCVNAGSCYCGDAPAGSGARTIALSGGVGQRLGHCLSAGYRTLVAVPIELQHRVLGEIDLLYRDERALVDEDRSMLETMASHLASAMEGMRAAALDVEAAVAHERELLAQELHDSIAQSLAFLKIQVKLLRDAAARGDPSKVDRVVDEIDAGVRESYSDVRELLLHFRTRTRDEDIEPALRTTLSKFEHQTGLHVQFDIEGHGLPLDPDVQVQALHIVQEALSNVRKHAGAQRVWLRVQQAPVWRFEVRDDGRGFDAQASPGETQVGLRIARERAQRIGGRVEVESAPDEGTRVILTLPPQASQASRAGEGAAATEAGGASASGAAREAKTPLAGSAT